MTTATRPPVPRRALAAVVGLVLAAGCASGDTPPDARGPGATGERTVYPGARWARGDAADLGFDEAALAEIASAAEAAGSNCLLVTRHGRIAGEWYWNGATATGGQEVFSVTKSVASTLVGIAQANGQLDVDDAAADYVDAWAGTRSGEVTIADLLGNDSGREWSVVLDYVHLPAQPDSDAFAAGLSQDAAPGVAWAYNNAAIQTLDVVLRHATGRPVYEYAAGQLFEPIGMAHSAMTTDVVGNTRIYAGLQSTCQDLARLGYLFLRGGQWDGRRILPRGWVEAAVGRPSQELNDAYGYLWWLNRPGTVLDAGQATAPGGPGGSGGPGDRAGAGGSGGRSQLVPGAPEDMFFALGLGDQIVAVDPSSDTVVVRLGGATRPTGDTAPFDAAAAASVVTDALVDPDA